MGPDPVGEPMVDGPKLQVDAFEDTKDPLEVGQLLVGADGLGSVKPRRRQRGA